LMLSQWGQTIWRLSVIVLLLALLCRRI